MPNTEPVRQTDLNWRSPGFPQEPTHPVVQVSYLDALAFCEWLSQQEQATYRLPTEAEWEYACRAGSVSDWCFGDERLALYMPTVGNCADELLRQHYGVWQGAMPLSDGHAFTAPVGSYIPNAFGLYDMHGNVVEWCSDVFDPAYYHRQERVDPQGAGEGGRRAQRGGAFIHHILDARCAKRRGNPETYVTSIVGFRMLREVSSLPSE
jgi:sulfatase modifying factor 1